MLLTVLAVNLMGDWLRDHLDPKLRQAGAGTVTDEPLETPADPGRTGAGDDTPASRPVRGRRRGRTRDREGDPMSTTRTPRSADHLAERSRMAGAAARASG